MKDGQLHVTAWGFFGIGNLGNEGSLATFLAYLRQRHPDAVVTCLAVDAEATERQHGVRARQLMTYRADPSRRGHLVDMVKAASRAVDIPRTFLLLRGVDVLVVPGTGVLETELTPSPWGLAYWLFLAVLCCRLNGGRTVLASVGAQRPPNPLTRQLYRWTVALSDYCSARDARSAEVLRELRTSTEVVLVPDLTFAAPMGATAPVRRGHVVVGVMSYDGAASAGAARAALRGRYHDSMTRFVLGLVDAGRSVTLLIGDAHDLEVASGVETAVRRVRPLLGDRLAVSPAGSLDEIQAEMTQAELVVASRFHNLVCALKLAKPTISLSYADKNVDLLAEFGLAEFSQPIDGFDADLLAQQADQVVATQPERQDVVRRTLERLAADVMRQLQRLSETYLVTPSPSAR